MFSGLMANFQDTTKDRVLCSETRMVRGRRTWLWKAAACLCLAAMLRAAQQPSARNFPDTTSSILVFSDQLNTSAMTEAQFQFAAAHYAGSQKLLPNATRRLRSYNPNYLMLHYRLGQGL